jgi:hypothetical protein
MTTEKQIRIGIHNARKMNKSAIVYVLKGIDEADRDWKGEVKRLLEATGWEVVALSVAHNKGKFDVVATCYQRGESPKARAEIKRRKPVTRGGVPVTGPVKTGRTMAGKVRALRTGGK